MREKTFRLEMVQGDRFFAMPVELLVGKYINDKKSDVEIVASVIYNTKSNLNRYERKNSSGYLVNEDGSYSRKDIKFHFTPSEHAYSEIKGEYYSRLTTVKKKTGVIDETKEIKPIIILDEANVNLLAYYVFEYIRDNIVSGLYPNVLNVAELAGDLKISLEEASKLLMQIENGETTNHKLNNEKIKLGKTSIKNYCEWVNFLFMQMLKRGMITKLDTFVSPTKIYPYEIETTESKVREIISFGLKTNQIRISRNTTVEKSYKGFDDYIPDYAQSFKDRIESITKATHYLGDISDDTSEQVYALGRIPYPIQLDAIEAGLKSLKKQNKVVNVGDPGVGKTYIMSVQAYLDAKNHGQVAKILTFSPDHLIDSSWAEEVKVTFGDKMKYHIIKTVKDLVKLENLGYLDDGVDRMFILPQTAAKSGYSKKPIALWSKKTFKLDEEFGEKITKKVFSCPNCGAIQMMTIKNPDYKSDNSEPKYITVPVRPTFYATERSNNKTCTNKECHGQMWSVNNKKAKYKEPNNSNSGYVYTSIGYLPNDLKSLKNDVLSELQKHEDKIPLSLKNYRRAVENLEYGIEKKVVSVYKVPIAEYIFKKCRNKFTHLILDEVHEVQNASSRTAAAAKLVSSIPKVICGTGTLMNGYAKSLFGMFFMLFPQKMKAHGYQIDDAEKFQAAYGVTEKTFKINEKTGGRNSLASKSKPGISPVIFPLFLQDVSVFINFDELKIKLPELKNVPVPVKMPSELTAGKNALEAAVAEATKGDLKLFKSMLPLLTSYLDSPSVEKVVKDIDGNIIYRTKPLQFKEDAKLNALIRILKKEIDEKDNRAIIYTYYTGDGINEYLKNALENKNYKVCILNKTSEYSLGCDGEERKVQKNEREKYIKEQVKMGCDILITNPELVKTGTNLIDFAPIIRYQMDYKVYTERQSKGRTRRIGQTKEVNIYYLFYAQSMQEEINKVMATKVVASESIEGKMDSKGLEAMSNTRTPEEELAKRFFEKMGL